MAASPKYKIFTPDGTYEGSVKHPRVAVALASLLGPGATVRISHSRRHTVWTEGDAMAGANYDRAAYVMAANETRIQRAELARVRGQKSVEGT